MKQSKAVVKERQTKILEMLKAKDVLRVSQAKEALGVSEITIRRDFEELHKKGALVRFHGGARSNSKNVRLEPAQKDISSAVVERKQRIARVAANMVEDGNTVFLNAGTTTLEVLRHIMKKNVRVITNNAVATAIYPQGGAQLICIGGEYNPVNHSFIGELAVPLLKKVHSSITILGVNGISSNYGATTHDYKETVINDLMLKRCNGKKIVLADGSKIGKSYCFASATFDMIDILITDSSADKEELAAIENLGVEIVVVDI